MMASHGSDTEAPSSWLPSIFLYCAPLTSCLVRKPRRSKSSSLTTASISWPLGRASDQDLLIDKDDEKVPHPIIHDQPVPIAEPAKPEINSRLPREKGRPSRKSFGSSRTVSSFRKRFRFDDGPSHRPQISRPSDFRHLETGSFEFPPPQSPAPQLRRNRPARPSSFRPLELSIYMSNNHMSPILPHFDSPNIITHPQSAQLQERLGDDHQLVRQRSNSSTPFHLPRKSIRGNTNDDAPIIPPRSQARPRACTSPEIETMKARVAGAMVEVERLQKQIDDVIERQSLYACSRPSTSHSMARTMSELEPMPSIPALPPAAPSFAERLNCDVDRPQTAPLKTAGEISNRSQKFGEVETAPATPTCVRHDARLPPPPLPLVLRPPLRKKKSFSRVSTWLFPINQHNRDVNRASVTNLPRPVKGTEGFYQCVAPDDNERRSFESVGTVSTWDSDEQQTVPTTWSPASTPVARKDEPPLERTATFGRRDTG